MATYRKKKTQKIQDEKKLIEHDGRLYDDVNYGYGRVLQDLGVGGSTSQYEKAATALLAGKETKAKTASKYADGFAGVALAKLQDDIQNQQAGTALDREKVQGDIAAQRSAAGVAQQAEARHQAAAEQELELVPELAAQKRRLNEVSIEAMLKELKMGKDEQDLNIPLHLPDRVTQDIPGVPDIPITKLGAKKKKAEEPWEKYKIQNLLGSAARGIIPNIDMY